MVCLIEDSLAADASANVALLDVAACAGYSPVYCSKLFRGVTGTTIRSYVAGRRLCLAADELAKGGARLIDVAFAHGFSSQEAFTRAFVSAYGRTPAAYKKNPCPPRISIEKFVFLSENPLEGELFMHQIQEAKIRNEYVPAHKYIGIWEPRARDYCEFWEYHGCDEILAAFESLLDSGAEESPIITAHTAGWYYVNGERRYFYGMGVSNDYNGPLPKGFEIRSFPGSYYETFFHPAFDYPEQNGEVMGRVEKLAWGHKPNHDWEFNEDVCQIYQRHNPEVLGYEILRPMRRIK